MKRIIALCSTLCLGVLLILTGCGNNDKLPNIEGTMDPNVFKTAISVKSNFVDTEEHDLYYDKVKTYMTLSSTGDEAKELYRKDVTIVKPSAVDDQIERKMAGKNIEFTGLTADTKYLLKLVISSSGTQKTLSTKEVTTINSGESEEDPILINNLDMLLGMINSKDSYYKLTADIDCGGSLSPIFNSSTSFTGHLDGDGHKIYNYKLESNQYVGLLGHMSGATVKDLVLEDVSYEFSRSNSFAGALAGYAKRCVISNVKVQSLSFEHTSQSSSYAYVGGLIGQAVNSTITDCSITNAKISIVRSQLKVYAGGFVGENKGSKIENCSVEGKIDATLVYNSNKDGCLYLGGFCGVNDSSFGVSSCTAKTDIVVSEQNTTTTYEGSKTFKLYVGGFNGGNINDASKFSNCASYGDIEIAFTKGYFGYIGGFSGYTDDQNISTYTNCIYIPKEKGLSAKFAETPKEEDKSVEQEAYISLTLGKVGAKNISSIHVICYEEKITIENEHDKVHQTPYVIQKDLSSFNSVIQNFVSKL